MTSGFEAQVPMELILKFEREVQNQADLNIRLLQNSFKSTLQKKV